MQPSPLPLKGGGILHRCFDTPEDSTCRFQFARKFPATPSAFPPAEGMGSRNVGCIVAKAAPWPSHPLWDAEVHPWLSTHVCFGVKLVLHPAGHRVDCLGGEWGLGVGGRLILQRGTLYGWADSQLF